MDPEIIFLDDSADLRDLLCLYVRTVMKVPAAGFASLKEIEDKRDAVLHSKVAILDIELGANQPSGIDVYRWLMENHYYGKIFFLTGHGNIHPGVKEAMNLHAPILEKPINGPALINYIKPALNSTGSSRPPENHARH